MSVRPPSIRRPCHLISAVGVAVVASVLAACSSSATSSSNDSGAGGKNDKLKIGFVTTLSNSSFTGVGVQAKAGFDAAIAVEKGKGAKVQTFVGDDQGDPRQATQTCQRLVQQEHVDVIVAVMLTPNKNACNLIAQQAKVPFIAGQQSAVNCGPTYFQTGWIPNQVIDPSLKYLATKNVKSIYYVGNDYAFDHEILSDLKAAAAAAGMQVIGDSLAPVGTTNWSPIFARVANAHPDVVIDGMVDEIAYQKQASTDPRMKALRRLGLTLDEGQLRAAGPTTEGMEYVTQYISTATNADNVTFKAALKKADSSIPPSLASDNLYSATQIAIAAAQRGGVGNLLKTIPTMTISTPGGPLAFNGAHNTSMTTYIAKMGPGFQPTVEYTQQSVAPKTNCK